MTLYMKYKIIQLGELEVIEIYDYFDGPKFFAVRDYIGNFYLVYWCDYENEAEGWLYLPISETRLDSLRKKEVSAHEVFAYPEIGYWLVYTKVHPVENETIQFHNIDTIEHSFFPPEGMFVEYVDVVEKGESNWDHELKIKKDSARTTPSAEVATEILGLWTSIIESTMNMFSKSQKIHFISAIPGSLEVKVGSTNSEIVYKAIKHFYNVIQSTTTEENDLESNLYSAGLEPQKLRDLFETVRRYKLNLEIAPRSLGVIEQPIVINHHEANEWISRLEPLASTVLGTDKIPQANEIQKIIDIVKYKAEGVDVTAALLEITDRQVRYYEDASENLGLLDKNGHLTSIGSFVNAQNTDTEKLSALAIRFETSDCGWSWIKWSGVNSLVDLEADTAVDFLVSVAPGLSENTAKRRATTLKKWLDKLKQYHYKFIVKNQG